MQKKSNCQRREEWDQKCWCVATFEVSRGIVGRSQDAPAQWVYFLWEPTDRAIPYREPHSMGLVDADPWVAIMEDCNGEPMYELFDDECDWSTWLNLALHLEGVGDWTAVLLRKVHKEKESERLARWARQYGSNREHARIIIEPELSDEESETLRDTGDFDSDDSLLRKDELPNTIAPDEPESSAHCSCISAGAFDQGFLTESALGYDMTNSCYGDVSILICKACARRWLQLLIEDEAFTASGRWYLGSIAPELASRMSAELAVPYLSRLKWYWRGGSYFKGVVSKSRGKPYT